MPLQWMLRKSFGDDEDEDTQAFMTFIYTFVFFLVLTWLTFQEFRYFIFSHTAIARVTDISTDFDDKNDVVRFQFTDHEGNSVSHYDHVKQNIELSGDTVEVQYFSGKPESARLKSEANWFAVVLFFLALGFMIYQIFRLAKEANEPFKVAGRPVRKRRRY